MFYSKMFVVILSVVVLSVVNDVQSRYVLHPEIHRSVLHKKVIATWDEAKSDCEAEGAVLASPLDENMLEYMKSSIGINNHTTPYFIGFRATSNPKPKFASVEGVPLDDLPEVVMNMIEQLDPQDGDCLGMDHHNIRVVSCRAQLSYMCYKNDTLMSTSTTTISTSTMPISTTTMPISTTTMPISTTTMPISTTIIPISTSTMPISTSTVPIPAAATTDTNPVNTTETIENCSLGYTNVSGSYYKIHTKAENWDDAQQICTSEGGYLAVINDEQEAQVVTRFASDELKISGGWTWLYVGLRDHDKNGNWRSVLGDPLEQIYHTWSPGHDGNDCGSIVYEGYLDDLVCLWHVPYICEKQC